ncbi:Protein of unknown function [Bacillus wiedmannii]|uniref:Uncharacterized protein n=1 Tax=Bacillus wiedmannii TaxID=1890302 RepID=A0A1C4EKS4_9BACI|nr:Protein of unknown function [Bacillus wiedmannii]
MSALIVSIPCKAVYRIRG